MFALGDFLVGDIVYALSSPNTNNQYATIGGNSLAYDDAGNMTGDHNGYTYHYDYENRLTRVKKSSDTVDVAVYTYDTLGRRIAVEDCIADTTTHYYYDGWRVLSETDDNDDWLRDYDYGNYIDEVLVMTDASDDHYFAHDHLFSVVALTDEDGDILEQYEYDAYGKCHFYDSSFTLLGTQKSGHGNDRLFTSQVLDILDGGALSLEYFKNRYKKDGRFITRDPLGVRDGICIIEFAPTGAPIFPRPNNAKNQYHDGMSLYEYVKSNPIYHKDTYGLRRKTWPFMDWFNGRERTCKPWQPVPNSEPEWDLWGITTPIEFEGLSSPEPIIDAIITIAECSGKNATGEYWGIDPRVPVNKNFACYCYWRNKQKCQRCCTVYGKTYHITDQLDLQGNRVVKVKKYKIESYKQARTLWGQYTIRQRGTIVNPGTGGKSYPHELSRCSCEETPPEPSAPPACNKSCK